MLWVVGDVHGCAEVLLRLLERIRFDPAADEIWFTGDLVNRGPESARSLQLFGELGGRGVLGNHDVHALRVHAGRVPNRWRELDSLLAKPDVDAWMDRLRRLPLLVRLPVESDGRAVWLVHAGLHPAWLDLPDVATRINREPHDAEWLESDDTAFATNVRFCHADGRRSRTRRDGRPTDRDAVAWDALYRGEAIVVHGHWAQRGHYVGRRTVGLDSGCVYGGGLTAWAPAVGRFEREPSR